MFGHPNISIFLLPSTSLQQLLMAKSTRSKNKRSFRRSKREDGVYAATNAARLKRLSQKLATIAQVSNQKSSTDETESQEDLQDMTHDQGWQLFALFGLVDQDELTIQDEGPGITCAVAPCNRKRFS